MCQSEEMAALGLGGGNAESGDRLHGGVTTLTLSMNMGCFLITTILSDIFQLFFTVLQRKTKKKIFSNKNIVHVTMDQNVEDKQKRFL